MQELDRFTKKTDLFSLNSLQEMQYIIQIRHDKELNELLTK